MGGGGGWIKHLLNGCVDMYKARLVAQGFHQRPEVDFHDTFNPVIKYAMIRFVLGTAVACDWSLKQLDLKNTFLHGSLDEKFYILLPPELVDKDRLSHVCHLKKAIYCLKQAP